MQKANSMLKNDGAYNNKFDRTPYRQAIILQEKKGRDVKV